MKNSQVSIGIASEDDRQTIYRLRHQVYAVELGQHEQNPEGILTDRLDAENVYIVAKIGSEIAGFVSVTPPNRFGYSIDKYFSRHELPL